MNRDEFEGLSDKRSVVKREYNRVCVEIYDNLESYVCPLCGKRTVSDPHHIWPRSKSPLWYYFQPENIIFLCRECHRKIHDQGLKFGDLEERRKSLEIENRKFYYGRDRG